jgi:hypothetical protein
VNVIQAGLMDTDMFAPFKERDLCRSPFSVHRSWITARHSTKTAYTTVANGEPRTIEF